MIGSRSRRSTTPRARSNIPGPRRPISSSPISKCPISTAPRSSAAFARCPPAPPCRDVPVMVITAYEDRDLRYQALEAGATDFLLSPVDHHEFRVRSRNLLTLRRQQLLLKERASSLEEQILVEEQR